MGGPEVSEVTFVVRFLREGRGGRLRVVDGLPPIPPDPQDDPAPEPTVAKLPNAFGIWERTAPR